MSATGRGTVRDEKDFYPTPFPAVGPLLPHLPTDVRFWEPCAGDGRLIRWIRGSGRIADGSDLFPQAQAEMEYKQTPVDYLQDTTQREFIATNPPLSIAFEMAQHALKHSREFMFLLRLSFLESEERGQWFEQHEPAGLWVLKKRPSFAMSITCKTVTGSDDVGGVMVPHVCKHNWMLPTDAERPKVCPKCGGNKLAISTSDSSGYAWYYWGHRAELSGIHHI